MTSKCLPKAFLEALARHSLKVADFSRKTHIPESEFSRLKTDGKNPNPDVLKAIIRGGLPDQEGWKDNSSWLILRAHLLDECEKAGVKGPFLQVGPGVPEDSLDSDVRKLDAFLRSNTDLRKSLKLLATYLPQESDLHEVAEPTDSTAVSAKVKPASNGKAKTGAAKQKSKV